MDRGREHRLRPLASVAGADFYCPGMERRLVRESRSPAKEIMPPAPTTVRRDHGRVAVPERLVLLLGLVAVAFDVDDGRVAPTHLYADVGVQGELPLDLDREGSLVARRCQSLPMGLLVLRLDLHHRQPVSGIAEGCLQDCLIFCSVLVLHYSRGYAR